MNIKNRSFQKNQLPELNNILKTLGMSDYVHGDFTITGQDPVIYSPHRLGYGSAVAQGANALLAGMIWQHRTGEVNNASMSIEDGLHYLHYSQYTEQNGYAMSIGAGSVPINSFFKCKDGREIHTMAGPPYKALMDGYLNFFNCGNDRNKFAAQCIKWNSYELEEALSIKGLPACVARSKEEWLQHPVGKQLSKRPIITIKKIADGEPIPYSSNPQEILEGFKLLDFTHVLAGPMCGQYLGRFGADVVHITSPYNHRDTIAQNLITNFCKKNAYLDLKNHIDLKKMKDLLSEADIFINSYRLGVKERFGLGIDQAVNMTKKGIIYVDISCYGHDNIWSDRPGFETIGQSCSGFAVTEAEGDIANAKFSPVFYLCDPLTGFFALSGTLAAIHKRALFGGSYLVRVCLAKSGMWVENLGLIDKEDYKNQHKTDIRKPKFIEIDTEYGKIRRIADAYEFDKLKLFPPKPVRAFGADMPTFS